MKDRYFDIFCFFLLACTLFIFLPAQIYYNNVAQYTYFFYEYLAYAALVLMVSTIIYTLAVFVFKEKMQTVSVIIVALAFLCILQANVLSWNYGVFDGSEIEWKEHFWEGILDSFLWIGVTVAAMVFRNKIYQHHLKGITLFLFLFQLLNVSYISWNYHVSGNSKHDYLKINESDRRDDFSFSGQDNVMIIMLDSYRSDIFNEIIADEGFYRNIFRDFTYYRNNIGGYPTTFPSIPLMMTGKYYQNHMPIMKFIAQEYVSDSLPGIFLKKGYDVSLVPFDRMIYPATEISNHFIRKQHSIRQMIGEVRESNLNSVVFFACMPTFARAFLVEKVQFYNDDLEFIKKFKDGFSSDNPRKAFKYYHLRGGHPPMIYDENLNVKKMPNNSRASYKAQAKADLKMCLQIFELLKRDKIYDHSLIVVMSDHGNPECEMINPFNHNRIQEDTVIKTAIPILLVKQRQSKQRDIRISDEPTTNGDLKNIVMGRNLPFSNDRRYYYYDWKHECWRSDYLPPFTEYRVNGHAWRQESWTPTGNVLSKQGVVKNNIINYDNQQDRK